jgi:hypothetical protein
MNLMMLNAVSVMNRCVKSIAVSVSRSRDLVSILPIPNNSPRRLSRTYSEMQSAFGTLSARSHQGFNSRLKGVARGLAVVIGLSLSIASIDRSEASIVPNKKLRELANYQLTDKQYQCHNQIVHRESSWNINAIGNKSGTKQTHGYYQIKSEHVKGKPYDYQFYIYWYYVLKRYGLDNEIPDYCKALHHLKTKGWQ